MCSDQAFALFLVHEPCNMYGCLPVQIFFGKLRGTNKTFLHLKQNLLRFSNMKLLKIQLDYYMVKYTIMKSKAYDYWKYTILVKYTILTECIRFWPESIRFWLNVYDYRRKVYDFWRKVYDPVRKIYDFWKYTILEAKSIRL